MNREATNDGGRDWRSAWPDAAGFLAGLALAWWGGWDTADLVWSLWFSSLVVGYAMIVWSILGPGSAIVRGVWTDRALVASEPLKSGAGLGILFVGALFMLAFFTVHFGGFHFVHSVFLNAFFPVLEGGARGFPGADTYLEVARRYWVFLPVAFLAERAAFRLAEDKSADTSVTAGAIARRKSADNGGRLMAPYKNVVRLHLLIFFFAFAHFMKWENFAVYAVVYAVYFFPWRLLWSGKPRAKSVTQ